MPRISIFNSIVTVGFISIFSACSDCKPDTSLSEETTKITEVSNTKIRIYTDVVINASANEVWATLTDFKKMANWSSTLKRISGDFKNGGSVVVSFDLGNDQVVEIPRSPIVYQEGVLFGWAGDVALFKGVTDNHSYKVEAISKCQTRFIQTEEFEGFNPNMTLIDLANISVDGYKTFNKELKKAVENSKTN